MVKSRSKKKVSLKFHKLHSNPLKSTKAETFVVRGYRLQSALPEITQDPKFYVERNDLMDMIERTETNLALRYRHQLLTEKDLGIHIDTVDINSYNRGTRKGTIHENDKTLLMDEQQELKEKRREESNIRESWLRRNEYMTSDDHIRKVQSKDKSSKQKKKSEEEIRRDIEEAFKFEIPIDHPKKSNVHALEVYDLCPDETLWLYDYVHTTFRSETLPRSRMSTPESLPHSLYRGGLFTELDENSMQYSLPPKDVKDEKDFYNHENWTKFDYIRKYKYSEDRNSDPQFFFRFHQQEKKLYYNRITRDLQLMKYNTKKKGDGEGFGSMSDQKPSIYIQARELTEEERERESKRRRIGS